ncbi:hypothetical protein [Citrobacter koseri]|uniref:hypothetical protein n=1 Tax=Citrobacter koseri TaxID=545 RepID=UPI0038926302
MTSSSEESKIENKKEASKLKLIIAFGLFIISIFVVGIFWPTDYFALFIPVIFAGICADYYAKGHDIIKNVNDAFLFLFATIKAIQEVQTSFGIHDIENGLKDLHNTPFGLFIYVALAAFAMLKTMIAIVDGYKTYKKPNSFTTPNSTSPSTTEPQSK